LIDGLIHHEAPLQGAANSAARLEVIVRAAPTEIIPPVFADAQQPHVAIGDDESIFVTFGRGEEVFPSVSERVRSRSPSWLEERFTPSGKVAKNCCK